MSEGTTALSGPRSMSQLIPPYSGSRGVTTWGELNGWTSKSGFNMIMYETYFDMIFLKDKKPEKSMNL